MDWQLGERQRERRRRKRDHGMLRVSMIKMRAEKLWWGRRGRWRERWQLALSPRRSLRTDSELIYSLFPFHLITVAVILSISLTFTISSSKPFLFFREMHRSDASDTPTCVQYTHADISMCPQTQIIATTKLLDSYQLYLICVPQKRWQSCPIISY